MNIIQFPKQPQPVEMPPEWVDMLRDEDFARQMGALLEWLAAR